MDRGARYARTGSQSDPTDAARATVWDRVRLIYDNSNASLINAPSTVIDALRYDLAYDSGAPPQPGRWLPDGSWDPGWDGWYRMISPWGKMPAGLVPHALRLLAKWGIAVEVIDQRERPLENIPLMSQSLPPLRDYQIAAVNKALAEGRGVIDSAPRSGKTTIGIVIVDKLALPTLWIAPTRGIVKQTVRAIQKMLGGVEVIALTSETSSPRKKEIQRKKARSALVVVTTEATAVKLGRGFFDTRDVLIYDEFHHSASDRGQEINRLAENVYYRFGLTGTHFRSDENSELRMHAVLSNVIERISVTRLVNDGWIVPAHVVMVPVEGPRVYTRSVTDAFDEAITYHEGRNGWICWLYGDLRRRGYRPLILVNRVAHGEEIQRLLAELRVGAPHFVNAKTQTAQSNQEAIDQYNRGEQEGLIGTSVLGEGVDLPAADALIYAKAGRAAVTVTQDIFRVLTKHPGKARGLVFDFADRHHEGFLRQSVARGKIYAAEDTFRIDVLSEPTLDPFLGAVDGR